MKIVLTLLILLTLFSLNTFAQDFQYTVLEGHTDWVSSVAFSPEGQTLASGSSDATIRLWDARTGAPLRTLIGHTSGVRSVAFSPEGQTLASGSSDATIRLWDATTGAHLRTLEGHTSGVLSVAFSPEGQTLASGSSDNTVRLWDATTGAPLRTLEGHTSGVLSVAFSPEGQTLASAGRDGTVRLWDANTTGVLPRTLTGHTDWVSSVAFSPEGRLLASGSDDDTVRLWDAATGAHLQTLTGHTYPVNSVAFSPDGQTLASGSNDGTVRLWNTNTGAHPGTLEGHTGLVNSIAFSPDGQTLAIASDDDTVRLWELPDTRVGITVLPVDAPAIGDQLTLNIDITGGENVAGYEIWVRFDSTALRYVQSANGDYLPDNSFFVPPFVEGDRVALGATSLAEDSSGDGTLATLTFEFIAIKESTLTVPKVRIVNSVSEGLPFLFSNSPTVVGVPRLREDINLDGVVNILDLTLVAASFGKHARRRDPADPVVVDPADVNGDGSVDIVDLVLVAGALGNAAAAPFVYPQALWMFTAAEVQQWLTQAQQLNLTDATSQRGILFLEQLLAALTPKKTSLLPNYPNPFNPETWIPYQLAEPADVTLRIYAMNGTVVRTLALGHQTVGIYQDKSRAAYWDGKNALGESVASGVYFYTLTAGDFTATRKLLIRK